MKCTLPKLKVSDQSDRITCKSIDNYSFLLIHVETHDYWSCKKKAQRGSGSVLIHSSLTWKRTRKTRLLKLDDRQIILMESCLPVSNIVGKVPRKRWLKRNTFLREKDSDKFIYSPIQAECLICIFPNA